MLFCRFTAHSCFCVSGWSGSQCHFAGSAGGRSDTADEDEENEVGKAGQCLDGCPLNLQLTSTGLLLHAHDLCIVYTYTAHIIVYVIATKLLQEHSASIAVTLWNTSNSVHPTYKNQYIYRV